MSEARSAIEELIEQMREWAIGDDLGNPDDEAVKWADRLSKLLETEEFDDEAE